MRAKASIGTGSSGTIGSWQSKQLCAAFDSPSADHSGGWMDDTSTDVGWIVEFRAHLLDDIYRDDSVDMVTRGVSEDTLSETISEAEDRLRTFEEHLEWFVERVGLESSEVFDSALAETPLSTFETTVREFQESIDRLERWSRFDCTRSTVLETPAAPVVERVESGDLGPEDLVPCYEGNLADGLLAEAFRERDALAQFDGEVHEGRIETFQELDRQSLKIHRKRVLSKLVERTPQLLEGASKSSPAGTLFHEFGKERRHKPIRVLLQEAGQLVQQMKPCFIMSPLSVAKYLEPDGIEFDVVIFDEASQVKPEDALGTIVRGTQVVMLGDTKQLPPTSFFDQEVDQREPRINGRSISRTWRASSICAGRRFRRSGSSGTIGVVTSR